MTTVEPDDMVCDNVEGSTGNSALPRRENMAHSSKKLVTPRGSPDVFWNINTTVMQDLPSAPS